jgi:hypothetical protein
MALKITQPIRCLETGLPPVNLLQGQNFPSESFTPKSLGTSLGIFFFRKWQVASKSSE